jgi:endonuclease V-like protein UPF0215 family
MTRFGNVVAFDDAPFARDHRGDVLLVGVVCARTRMDGVLSGRVRRDGRNATRSIIGMLERSQFRAHVQAILLQGIAVAGFNVVDIRGLHEALRMPVLVVARRAPRVALMRAALFSGGPQKRGIPGAAEKWRLIERAGPMEPLRDLYVPRVGLTRSEAGELLRGTTLHGNLPEAIRLAHLVAGGVTTGTSRGRA